MTPTPVVPRISFVVPVRNGAAHLDACLSSILSADLPPDALEVIVADSGSTDDSCQIAGRHHTRLLRLSASNAASARNEAARHARADVLAFVDADHEIGAEWPHVALELLARPGVEAVGAPYQAPENGNWVQRAYDSFRRRTSGGEATGWLASGNLAVSREAFELVGGFDTSLETCEDVDLSLKLRATGATLLSDPRLTSVHHGDPRSLPALFRGELWRGRDNLIVSFRHPLKLRDLPSVLSPLVILGTIAAVPVGLVTWPFGGRWILAVAALLLGGLAGIRAVTMVSRRREGLSLLTFGQSFVVACVYEAARALALVGRTGHEARRRA